MGKGGLMLFLRALRNVDEAHGGMVAVSEKAKLNRESLYHMLSKKGNPEIKSIFTLLHSLGLKLSIEPTTRSAKSSRVKKQRKGSHVYRTPEKQQMFLAKIPSLQIKHFIMTKRNQKLTNPPRKAPGFNHEEWSGPDN